MSPRRRLPAGIRGRGSVFTYTWRDTQLEFVLGHSQIAHTVDLYGHLVPGRLEGLRATFDAAVSAAQPKPAPAPPADQAQPFRLRLVT